MKPPMKLFDEVSTCDDRLGAYADYEGNEDGPTYHLWMNGHAGFANCCDRAIDDHTAAIKVWRKLRKENEKRASSPVPAQEEKQ